MRHFLLMLLPALLLPFAGASANPNFYVCAHPDDCMLFMNPNLFDDVTRDTDKTVILYLTSGDAGEAFSKEETSYPYVREQASLNTTDWMADAGKQTAHAKRVTETVDIRGHAMDRVSHANTVSYFLRLPDGNMDGGGFELSGRQSLQKLKNGEIRKLSSIDGRTSYADWQDLRDTLSGILDREAAGAKTITVHLPDTDKQVNPGDHSDHLHGAAAIMEVLAQQPTGAERCTQLYKHVGYAIAGLSPNLDTDALQNKSGSFGALTATQQRFLGVHNWDAGHTSYLARNYYTTVAMPTGCQPAP